MKSKNWYKVEFLPSALNDMTEIVSSFVMLGSKAGAVRIKEKMKKAALQTAEFPYSGVAVPDEKISKMGFRMIVVEKYLMLYKVFDDECRVLFYRVLNGKRNYPTLFGKHRATGVQKEAYASQRIPHLKLFAGRTLSS